LRLKYQRNASVISKWCIMPIFYLREDLTCSSYEMKDESHKKEEKTIEIEWFQLGSNLTD